MFVDHDKLVNGFRKARQINEAYQTYVLDSSGLPLSIDDLVRVVSDIYDISVNIKSVDFQSQHLRGMIEKIGSESVNIYIKKQQEFETIRFVTVKELSHAIIDEPEDWNPAGCDTIDGFIEAEQFSIKNGEASDLPPEYIQGEAIALAVAIEIMFPYSMREDCYSAYMKGERTIMDLSQQFGMPKFAITRAFSDGYRKVADQAWAEIERQTFKPELGA